MADRKPFSVSVVTPDWTQYAMQALSICIILSVAWVIVGLIKALEATIVSENC